MGAYEKELGPCVVCKEAEPHGGGVLCRECREKLKDLLSIEVFIEAVTSISTPMSELTLLFFDLSERLEKVESALKDNNK